MSPSMVTVNCSFCAKRQSQVAKVIAGAGGVYICDECVALCNDIIGTETRETIGIDVTALRALLERAAHALQVPDPGIAAELEAVAVRLPSRDQSDGRT